MPSGHTQAAYETALRQFLGFWLHRNGTGAALAEVATAQLWRVSSSDMRSWQRALRESGLAPKTVNARLGALSSFFAFCARDVAWTDQAREVHKTLLQVNPCDAVKPLRVQRQPRVALDVAQVRALLRACDRTRVSGARDYALLCGYLLTGNRNSELRTLRWGDLRREGEDVLYRWVGKGGKCSEELLHPAVYAAIGDYLRMAGRLGDITEDDYVFTALTDAAGRFPHVARADLARPISRQRVNQIVKARARDAGIEPGLVSTHTLRRTAARRYFEVSGNDLDETAKMLHHSNLNVTQVYLNQPERASREIWKSVAALYGL